MLEQWVDLERARGYRVDSLGPRLGVNRVTLHRWLTGASSPTPAHRSGIETATGIAPSAWDMEADE